MNKVRSDTILDMNLEKSRVKELVSVTTDCTLLFLLYSFHNYVIISYFQKAEHEKKLLETRTEIMEMVRTCAVHVSSRSIHLLVYYN